LDDNPGDGPHNVSRPCGNAPAVGVLPRGSARVGTARAGIGGHGNPGGVWGGADRCRGAGARRRDNRGARDLPRALARRLSTPSLTRGAVGDRVAFQPGSRFSRSGSRSACGSPSLEREVSFPRLVRRAVLTPPWRGAAMPGWAS